MLKLAKLPDRVPIKLTIALLPDLMQALSDYAALYAEIYGQTAQPVDLVPSMLAAFMESDREFAKHRLKRTSSDGTARR